MCLYTTFSGFFIPLLRKRRGYTGLALSVLPSVFLPVLSFVLPSVANIFRRIFLSNHASQPLQTWYGVSARGSTRRLWNSGPRVIYFLFYDLVYFRPSVRNQYFPSHFSQQPCITATSNLVWCLGCRSYTSLTEFRFANYLLPVLRLSLSPSFCP